MLVLMEIMTFFYNCCLLAFFFNIILSKTWNGWVLKLGPLSSTSWKLEKKEATGLSIPVNYLTFRTKGVEP